MKKLLLIAFLIPLFQLAKAQEEIVKWTFPNNALSDTVQNSTNTLNLGETLRAEGSSAIAMKNGATTYAAQATGWDNGMDVKNWNIRFKTTGYTNLKISSKQQGGGTNGGPKDFKMQYKTGSTAAWTDLAGGIITLANDWTTGVITDLPLPAECDNRSDFVYIRWIMTTNTDVKGGLVTAVGITKIDDIVVMGIPNTGIYTTEQQQLKTFPNPSKAAFSVSAPRGTEKLEIYNNLGKLVYKSIPEEEIISIDKTLPAGIFFIKATTRNGTQVIKHIINAN